MAMTLKAIVGNGDKKEKKLNRKLKRTNTHTRIMLPIITLCKQSRACTVLTSNNNGG